MIIGETIIVQSENYKQYHKDLSIFIYYQSFDVVVNWSPTIPVSSILCWGWLIFKHYYSYGHTTYRW